MVATTFNAITYANKLKKAKDNNERADIEAEEMSNIISNNLASKEDMAVLRKDIQLLEVKIVNLKNEMVIKLGSLMVLGLTVLGFVLKN